MWKRVSRVQITAVMEAVIWPSDIQHMEKMRMQWMGAIWPSWKTYICNSSCPNFIPSLLHSYQRWRQRWRRVKNSWINATESLEYCVSHLFGDGSYTFRSRLVLEVLREVEIADPGKNTKCKYYAHYRSENSQFLSDIVEIWIACSVLAPLKFEIIFFSRCLSYSETSGGPDVVPATLVELFLTLSHRIQRPPGQRYHSYDGRRTQDCASPCLQSFLVSDVHSIPN